MGKPILGSLDFKIIWGEENDKESANQPIQ